MSVKFDVKMTKNAMFDFMLYTSYTSLSGIAGAVLGGAGAIFGIQKIAAGDLTGATPFILVAIFFLIGTPLSTWMRAAEQVLKTPMFQKPITYEFTEEGVEISQDGQKVLNEWVNFQKAVSTNKSIILYVTKIRALILPKESLGEQYVAAVQVISAHMTPKKVKIRHVSM